MVIRQIIHINSGSDKLIVVSMQYRTVFVMPRVNCLAFRYELKFKYIHTYYINLHLPLFLLYPHSLPPPSKSTLLVQLNKQVREKISEFFKVKNGVTVGKGCLLDNLNLNYIHKWLFTIHTGRVVSQILYSVFIRDLLQD